MIMLYSSSGPTAPSLPQQSASHLHPHLHYDWDRPESETMREKVGHELALKAATIANCRSAPRASEWKRSRIFPGWFIRILSVCACISNALFMYIIRQRKHQLLSSTASVRLFFLRSFGYVLFSMRSVTFSMGYLWAKSRVQKLALWVPCRLEENWDWDTDGRTVTIDAIWCMQHEALTGWLRLTDYFCQGTMDQKSNVRDKIPNSFVLHKNQA